MKIISAENFENFTHKAKIKQMMEEIIPMCIYRGKKERKKNDCKFFVCVLFNKKKNVYMRKIENKYMLRR